MREAAGKAGAGEDLGAEKIVHRDEGPRRSTRTSDTHAGVRQDTGTTTVGKIVFDEKPGTVRVRTSATDDDDVYWYWVKRIAISHR